MLNLQSPLAPDFDQYEQNIKAHGAQVYVDYQRYVLRLNNFAGLLATAERELVRLIRLISLNKYTDISTDSICCTLSRFCGINEEELTQTRADGDVTWSLDQVKIVQPLKEKLDRNLNMPYESLRNASELIDTYIQYKDYKTCVDNARAKLKRFKKTDMPGWSGDLVSIDFVYEQKDTGRYYTKNDNLQAWNLNMVPSITVPKGYFLFWADFAQIDLRVAYHIYLKQAGSDSDKIYQEESDKYRAIYKIMCKALDQEPDLDLFKQYRPAFKKAILSAIYNAAERSLAIDMKNKDLAGSLFTYVHSNSGYSQFRKILDNVIDFGIELPIKDYFGFTRMIPLPTRMDKWTRNQLVSKACNTPIQATSNGILMLWLENLLQGFEKYGFNRKEHVIPYLIRHDEAIFMVHQSVMPYLWVFNEFMQIALDDWGILELEPHIGLFYKEPMEELETAYAHQIEEHTKDYTPRQVNSPRKPVYRPISDVIPVYAYALMDDLQYLRMAYPGQSASTQQEACAQLEAYAQQATDPNDPAARWIRFRDKYVLYSRMLNKYKCVDDVAAAADIALGIGSKFIQLNNCISDKLSMVEDIYYRISSRHSDETLQVLNAMEAQGWPHQWVSLTTNENSG